MKTSLKFFHSFNDNIPSVIRDTGVDDIFYKKIRESLKVLAIL